MERLTGKENKKYTLKAKSQCGGSDFLSTIQKLGPLEDIEEELGIDLKVVIQALMFGFNHWNPKHTIRTRCPSWATHLFKDKKTNKWCLNICMNPGFVFLKDFGKTWALTKEGL